MSLLGMSGRLPEVQQHTTAQQTRSRETLLHGCHIGCQRNSQQQKVALSQLQGVLSRMLPAAKPVSICRGVWVRNRLQSGSAWRPICPTWGRTATAAHAGVHALYELLQGDVGSLQVAPGSC